MCHKEILFALGERAAALGLNAWVVGGAVRDLYLGKTEIKDIDITVDGAADELCAFAVKKWGGKAEKFGQYLTLRAAFKNGINLDFVRSRKEVYPKPAALPVVSPGTLKEDLFRRDFTVNAWALSIMPGTFGHGKDFYGAQSDIDARLIRVLHDNSFKDDPTRLYRAVRFAGRFEWNIEKHTHKLMLKAMEKDYPALLSRPRVLKEFVKILDEDEFERIFKLMDAYGLSKFITPGLKWSPVLAKARTRGERAGILSCVYSPGRPEWLEALQFRKEAAREIIAACEIYETKKSPLKELTSMQKNIIAALMPSLPQQALEPCVITGGEIEKMGFKGAAISTLMSRVQKMQWEGKIRSKEAAIKELSRLK